MQQLRPTPSDIAFTASVKAMQSKRGSRSAYARMESGDGWETRLDGDVATELALALGAAHAAGILHRDVKPANVLIATDGRARLVDFGLATFGTGTDTRITRYGILVGTPEYLAPEIARGADPDPRGDVYALGATLYEMLTGALPFDRPTPMATVLAHVNDALIAPSGLVPSLDTSVDEIVGALMARDPELRPSTGHDAKVALEALVTAAVAAAAGLLYVPLEEALKGRG